MSPHPISDRLEQLTGGRRLTVEEYHQLVQGGVFHEDDRVELLEGELVPMTPPGPEHAAVVDRLTTLFAVALQGRHRVRGQHPLTLARSEPQPDIAIIAGPDRASMRDPHPSTALLVIEVSSSSLRRDRGLKSALYAEAGVPEYWILDVEALRVEVRANPDVPSRRYRSYSVVEAAGTVRPRALPDIEVDLAELFR